MPISEQKDFAEGQHVRLAARTLAELPPDGSTAGKLDKLLIIRARTTK